MRGRVPHTLVWPHISFGRVVWFGAGTNRITWSHGAPLKRWAPLLEIRWCERFPWESRTWRMSWPGKAKTGLPAEEALVEDRQQLWTRNCWWFCRSLDGAWESFASPALAHRTDSRTQWPYPPSLLEPMRLWKHHFLCVWVQLQECDL